MKIGLPRNEELVAPPPYEAVSLNAIMTHESQRLYRKATFREGFL